MTPRERNDLVPYHDGSPGPENPQAQLLALIRTAAPVIREEAEEVNLRGKSSLPLQFGIWYRIRGPFVAMYDLRPPAMTDIEPPGQAVTLPDSRHYREQGRGYGTETKNLGRLEIAGVDTINLDEEAQGFPSMDLQISYQPEADVIGATPFQIHIANGMVETVGAPVEVLRDWLRPILQVGIKTNKKRTHQQKYLMSKGNQHSIGINGEGHPIST